MGSLSWELCFCAHIFLIFYQTCGADPTLQLKTESSCFLHFSRPKLWLGAADWGEPYGSPERPEQRLFSQHSLHQLHQGKSSCCVASAALSASVKNWCSKGFTSCIMPLSDRGYVKLLYSLGYFIPALVTLPVVLGSCGLFKWSLQHKLSLYVNLN